MRVERSEGSESGEEWAFERRQPPLYLGVLVVVLSMMIGAGLALLATGICCALVAS